MKKFLIRFAIVSILGLTSIHSQSMLDSTNVAYNKLSEFARYVEYKPYSDSIIMSLNLQLYSLDSAYSKANVRLVRFRDSIVPDLKNTIEISDREIRYTQKEADLKEKLFTAELKHAKGKKWTWAGIFGALGIVIGTLISF